MTELKQTDVIIQIERLTKLYNHRPALKNIDLQIRRGETLVIFGPNGAGKTTLLKILSTVIKPTSGNVTINGLDLKKDADDIRRHIGVVSHHTSLYGSLTAYENLRFYARLYDIQNIEKRTREVISMVGMASYIHGRVDTFSRGMQQRIAVARSLLHDPSVLLMDEPETGLDQQAISMLWTLLKEGGYTILLTTHSLERGLELADRIIILNKGRIAGERQGSDTSLKDCKQLYLDLTGKRS